MTRNQEKRSAFESMLSLGDLVCVQVNQSLAGVILPKLPGNEVLLVYGLHSPKPITDLEIDEAGIQATLSFNLIPAGTFVPWESVTCISDVKGDRAHLWCFDAATRVDMPQSAAPTLKLVD